MTKSTDMKPTRSANNRNIKVGESTYVTGKYLAKKNDEWIAADVLETRTDPTLRVTEYYVHYTNYDRRLDKWVSEDDIKQISNYEKSISDVAHSPNTSNIVSAIIPEIKITKMTRTQKKRLDVINETLTEIDGSRATCALEEERQELTKVKYITEIQLGKYEIDTWYFSPYPDEYGKCSKLWICEYCLFYSKYSVSLHLHERDCLQNSPPGVEVYRNGAISVYEIDGRYHKLYCQNLCLLAKLFLDHKTLFFDVEVFKFYVMCVVDIAGAHIVGFFSKEKNSLEMYNVACILVLPPHQKNGYGRLLIAFSYELTKLEGHSAGPETPLSDLGLLAYRSHWSWVVLQELYAMDDEVGVSELSFKTGIARDDILDTLNWLGLIKYMKTNFVVCITKDSVLKVFQKLKPPRFFINTAAIRWNPYNGNNAQS